MLLRFPSDKIAFLLSVLLLSAFLFSIVPAQEPDIAGLEKEIAARKAKLADSSLKPVEREKLLQEIAAHLNQAGEIRFNQNKYEAATALFVEADALLRQYHEIFYERMRRELIDAEQKLQAAEQGMQATEQIQQAADPKLEAERRGALQKIHRTLVSSYLSLAINEARYFADPTAHRKYLERLGEIARAEGRLNQEAESLEKIGALELDLGNSKTAFEIYDKALALRRKDGKGDWWTLDYIAGAHQYLGEYGEAARRYQEIIDITRRLDSEAMESLEGKNEIQASNILLERTNLRMNLVSALLNLAQVRALQGKYGAASETIAQAQKILNEMSAAAEKHDGEMVGSILRVASATYQAEVFRLQGRIAEAQGDEPAALKFYNDSVKYFSQLSGGNPSGAIAALRSRLALFYSRQGKFDEARANIREAMRIRARLHHEKAALFALNIASRIELDAGQTAEALKLVREAKSAAVKLNFSDLLAETEETEADALAAENPAQAIKLYESAIAVYRKLEMRPALARSLAALGANLEKIGRKSEAENALREAIEIIETIRTDFASASESENYSNRRDVLETYRRMIDLLMAQNRESEALQFAVRAQRWALVDSLPTGEIQMPNNSEAGFAEVKQAAGRERAVRSSLSEARQAEASDAKVENLTTQLKKTRREYEAAVKKLKAAQPALKLAVEPLDLTNLQKTLAPDEAAILYLVTNDRLYLFVAQRDKIAMRTVEIKQSALENLVAEVRNSLTAFSDDFYDTSVSVAEAVAREKQRPDLRKADDSEFSKTALAPFKNASSKLYETLIAPVEDLLAGAKTLKIVPNDRLFLLPFASLISPKTNRYLLEDYELVLMTSGDAPVLKQSATSGLVAFGNPTEANLDAALTEVKAIKAIFPRAQIFTDAQASKDRLFKLKSAQILHFATHGNVLTPLENSNIQLARLRGLEKPDLTYGEIYALPLESSEMIVMSACQTALGRAAGTKFGVFVEAFQTKARSVAASLWSVDDAATQTLMVEFYRNLAAGRSRADSLRRAQLHVLQKPETKHPLFWAAFVLYGDGGKLSLARTTTVAPARKVLRKTKS